MIPMIFFAILLIASICIRFSQKSYLKVIGKVIVTLYTIAAFCAAALLGTAAISLHVKNPQSYVVLFLIACILVAAALLFWLWGAIRKRSVFIPLGALAALLVLVSGATIGYNLYIENIPTVGEGRELLSYYEPYGEDTRVALLDGESEFRIESDFPRLDGATALYPIYSAFARALYPKEVAENTEYLRCTTTSNAYDDIIYGACDIVFAAAPSVRQKEMAEKSGVELEYTPIGKEAFVFFVNAKNPLENITIEQIQGIYSGEIRTWEALGVGGFGDIKAFQRSAGSGSQSALERLMDGKKLMEPPKDDVIDAMAGIIKSTADYKNFKNAIGYSFRFYSTKMVPNNQIKLLSVNGVYPSEENIANGTYPISSSFFAVTRREKSPEVKRVLDFAVSAEGQSLVKKTGYTPIAE